MGSLRCVAADMRISPVVEKTALCVTLGAFGGGGAGKGIIEAGAAVRPASSRVLRAERGVPGGGGAGRDAVGSGSPEMPASSLLRRAERGVPWGVLPRGTGRTGIGGMPAGVSLAAPRPRPVPLEVSPRGFGAAEGEGPFERPRPAEVVEGGGPGGGGGSRAKTSDARSEGGLGVGVRSSMPLTVSRCILTIARGKGGSNGMVFCFDGFGVGDPSDPGIAGEVGPVEGDALDPPYGLGLNFGVFGGVLRCGSCNAPAGNDSRCAGP